MQDTATAKVRRISPAIAVKAKCDVVTVTFSTAFPNRAPSIPAACLLSKYARGNAAAAVSNVSDKYCKSTNGFAIPTASSMPVSVVS